MGEDNFILFMTEVDFVNGFLSGKNNVATFLKYILWNIGPCFIIFTLLILMFSRLRRREIFVDRLLFVILILIEIVQFINPSGIFNIDDVILRQVGGVFGFKFGVLIMDLKKNEENVVKLICPYCKSEMTKGYIWSSFGGNIKWRNEFKYLDKRKLTSLFTSSEVKTYYCKSCNKMIMSVPPEGKLFGKIE